MNEPHNTAPYPALAGHAQDQLVDVYDATARAQWCLLVPYGARTAPLAAVLRTGVAAMGDLSLRAAGIKLGVLVPNPKAVWVAHALARDGGAVLPKEEILQWIPPGLAASIIREGR